MRKKETRKIVNKLFKKEREEEGMNGTWNGESWKQEDVVVRWGKKGKESERFKGFRDPWGSGRHQPPLTAMASRAAKVKSPGT